MKLFYSALFCCLSLAGCGDDLPEAENKELPQPERSIELGILPPDVHAYVLPLVNRSDVGTQLDCCTVSCDCIYVKVQRFDLPPDTPIHVKVEFDLRATHAGSFQFRVDFHDTEGQHIQSVLFHLDVVEQLNGWVDLPIQENQ